MHKFKSWLFRNAKLATALLALVAPCLSAEAEDYDQIVVLRTVADTALTESNPQVLGALPGALTMALADLGITPIDPRFTIAPNLDDSSLTQTMISALQEYDSEQPGRLIIMEVSAVADASNPALLVPRVAMIDGGSGATLAMVTTLPILPPFNWQSIDAGAVALARSIAKRLEDGGYKVKPGKTKPWGGPARKIRLALEGFDGCEQQAILTTMEDEFPGFLGMELEKAPNPTYAIYAYETTASKERLKKWIQLLMAENGVQRTDSVRLYVQRDDFRLQKVTDSSIFISWCGK